MSTDHGSWPIDPDGEEASENMRKYGIAVLSKFVGDEDNFPVTKNELLEEYGGYPVRLNHQQIETVKDLLAAVDADKFETKQAFHRAVGGALRREQVWTYAPSTA
ncbi:DUF5785 family protein [Halobacterium hubeiense]|uniref:DUF5785 family protein n=1 Tax=Halobacterium hubeiense TaxID=1407499 RepID=UPI000B7E4514|nr:DUF5785 family protein [Halobacterium hubeiense]